jgi:hypothetical protein
MTSTCPRDGNFETQGEDSEYYALERCSCAK